MSQIEFACVISAKQAQKTQRDLRSDGFNKKFRPLGIQTFSVPRIRDFQKVYKLNVFAMVVSLTIFLRCRNDGWYFGSSHLSRNKRQIYLRNDDSKSACANFLDPQNWLTTKDGEAGLTFPMVITCHED